MIKVFKSTSSGVMEYFSSVEDVVQQIKDFAENSREGDQIIFDTVFMAQKTFNDITEWDNF